MSSAEPTLPHLEETISGINQWYEIGTEWDYYVALDIGGTNCRVALRCTLPSASSIHIPKFEVFSTDAIISILTAIAKQLEGSLRGKAAAGAALDLAGRVLDNRTWGQVTNYPGNKDLHISALPPLLFPAEKTTLLNDFEACCFGVLDLNSHGRLSEYFGPLFSSSPSSSFTLRRGHYAVLGMGTGLGVGLLICLPGKSDAKPTFTVLPLEGSHCLLAAPGPSASDADELTGLIHHISKNLYNGIHPLEYEDICSGRGLTWTYQYLNPSAGDVVPHHIAERAASGSDPLAHRAMLLHYKCLMKASQNIAVASLCKGVLLAGDNQVNNDKFVTSVASELKQSFMEHPKTHWLTDVEMHRQTRSLNMNLLGCFFVAQHGL